MGTKNVVVEILSEFEWENQPALRVVCPVCRDCIAVGDGWSALKCQGDCPDTIMYRSEKDLQEGVAK